jgi:hypothetical protein
MKETFNLAGLRSVIVLNATASFTQYSGFIWEGSIEVATQLIPELI